MSLGNIKITAITVLNIVISICIMGIIGNVSTAPQQLAGNWSVGGPSSAIVIFFAATMSLVFHLLVFIASGSDTASFPNKLFLLHQIFLGATLFSCGISLINYTLSLPAQVYVLAGKSVHLWKAGASFGIIGGVTHGLSAFFSQIES